MACRPISANAPPARNGNVAARMVHAAPPALVRIVQKARARREESASAHRRKSVRSRAPRLDNSIVVLIIGSSCYQVADGLLPVPLVLNRSLRVSSYDNEPPPTV